MMVTEVALCPSSRWDKEGAQVFGVVGGTVRAPKVLYLKQMQAPSEELRSRLGDVDPSEVFRVAAPCSKSACSHHDGASSSCTLVTRVVKELDPVVDSYATCGIRASCVWWAQEGVKACVRCPQITTHSKVPGEKALRVLTAGKSVMPQA
jgi:hypothetical protein